MKENVHDIDKLFKAAIDDLEEAPSAGVWDAIDQHLDKNRVVDINRKYIQLKRIAIALLILLLGAGAYTLNTWTKAKEPAKYNNTKNNEQNNGTGALTHSQNKQDKIIIPHTINTDKSHEIEISNKTSRKYAENKKELDSPADITGNPALINSSKQRGKEI